MKELERRLILPGKESIDEEMSQFFRDRAMEDCSDTFRDALNKKIFRISDRPGPFRELFSDKHNSDIIRGTFSEYQLSDEICAVLLEIRKKDKVTAEHLIRASMLAVLLGHKEGLSDEDRRDLGQGVLFHDIGKLYLIDSGILDKLGTLSHDEWGSVMEHPKDSAQMLMTLNAYLSSAYVIDRKGEEYAKTYTLRKPVRDISLLHHRWPSYHHGRGGYLGHRRNYPVDGELGEFAPEEISDLVQLATVADALDCMTDAKHLRGGEFKPAKSLYEACKEFERESYESEENKLGVHFRPKHVKTLSKVVAPYIKEEAA